MHRIDGPHHVNNMFVGKDPATGQPGTVHTADWLNAVQEEIANAIEGAGIALSKGDNGQLLAAMHVLGKFGLINPLINPLFRVWQRHGPSKTLTEAEGEVFIPDRWACDVGDGSAAADITRELFDLGTIPPGLEPLGQPFHYLRWVQTTQSDAARPTLEQRIEDVRRFAGAEVTLSFAARVASGSLLVTPELRQSFGPGGSTPQVFHTGNALNVDTTWRRHAFTTTLSSLAGKVISSNASPAIPSGRSYLAAVLKMPALATFTLEVTDVRVDLGATVLPVWRSEIEDEHLCFRYCEKSWDLDTPIGANLGALVSGGMLMGWFEFDSARDTALEKAYRAEKYTPGGTVGDTLAYDRQGDVDRCTIDNVDGVEAAFTVPSFRGTGRLLIDPGETPSNAPARLFAHWSVDVEIKK